MSDKSAKSFLNLLQRSGIVPEDRLKKVLSELSKRAAGRRVNIDELTTHLIESGVITRWHYDKLINGKYKGFFLGKYKLLRHLGTGGMSSVYLAEHSITGHKRALKVLPRKKVDDKSYFDRFYLEGRAAASLNDPNIVRVYDICSEGDTHYMVMEYVEGRDLYEIVREEGALDFDLALNYIGQAAKGLEHAHAMKLVHRDIKPANLLVTGESVKILDLGLALLTEDEESLTVLHNEKVMGTADYLSPEQAVNSHEVDHRADIYSLGCTLYYLVTGHPPFPEGTLAQRIAMHQTKEPAEITVDRPRCPEVLVKLCKKMMQKKPEDRFATCKEVYDAVAATRKHMANAPVAKVSQVAGVAEGGVETAPELSAADVIPEAADAANVTITPDSGKAKPESVSKSHARSAADIRTDEIAQQTVDSFENKQKASGSISINTGQSSKSNPAIPLASKSGISSVSRRQARKKSSQNVAMLFAVMIGLMFVLLALVLIIAMQFSYNLELPRSNSLPLLAQMGHNLQSIFSAS